MDSRINISQLGHTHSQSKHNKATTPTTPATHSKSSKARLAGFRFNPTHDLDAEPNGNPKDDDDNTTLATTSSSRIFSSPLFSTPRSKATTPVTHKSTTSATRTKTQRPHETNWSTLKPPQYNRNNDDDEIQSSPLRKIHKSSVQLSDTRRLTLFTPSESLSAYKERTRIGDEEDDRLNVVLPGITKHQSRWNA